MTAKQILAAARDEIFEDEDGETYRLELRPGLSAGELRELEKRFPKGLPEHIRDLLAFTRGFEFGPVQEVDFTGDLPFAYEPAFPSGVPLAPDGFGNFWVVDVNPLSGQWGPVFYVCHDPPVIVYQSPDLDGFLAELLRLDLARRQGDGNLIDLVHDESPQRIWREEPGLLSVQKARDSHDNVLRLFAEQVGNSFELCDLRNAKVGDGFSWGRVGPNTEVRRCEEALLFAVEKKDKKGL